ncbi:MAG: hypothetical protein ABIO55_16535 [Ginsengibacter sp.]
MKRTLLVALIILFSFQSYSQLFSWTSDFITDSSDPVVMTVDAAMVIMDY